MIDCLYRILTADPENLEASRLRILFNLCREGDSDAVASGLEKFLIMCKKVEPNNGKYFIENARMFSQLVSDF